MDKLPFSWFDVVVIGMIAVGFWRGRTNGLSQEFIPLVQWLTIFIGCAFIYQPLGKFITDVTPFSLLSSYLAAYLLSALALALVFTAIRKAMGDKLASSDFFGRAEYYGGMPAGALRFLSIILFIMSIIGARLYTKEELEARARQQKRDFEDVSFPTFGSIQRAVNYDSFTAYFIKQQAPFLLIKPTLPANVALGGGKRPDAVDDMTIRKKN